jgi:D-sedoheptulose 7-phosphate isomerase
MNGEKMVEFSNIEAKLNQVVDLCVNALCSGNKIMFCGNGGSAADSQHLAAELIGRLNFNRPPLAALSLTTDSSILTAIGNDYGFDYVFSRQVEALGKEGDILIATSTSGNSPNVIKAINIAKKMDITVIGKTGQGGGKMAGLCDVLLNVPFTNTQKIQEEHIKLGHLYCSLIEKRMFAS